jgi:hypothetical protein
MVSRPEPKVADWLAAQPAEYPANRTQVSCCACPCTATISFDKNGDLTSRVISVFQIRRDTAYPAEDMAHVHWARAAR